MKRIIKPLAAIVVFVVVFFMAMVHEANASTTVTVSEGTVYYESSQDNGSGKCATVSNENPYTHFLNENECPVVVNGYSVIDNLGNIIDANYDEAATMLSIPSVEEDDCTLMLHIVGVNGGYRLGWVNANAVSFHEAQHADMEIQKQETVNILTEGIRQDKEIPRNSIVLADFSGSMSSFYDDVYQKLGDFDGERYIFAEKYLPYPNEGWQDQIGVFTDIYYPLNDLITEGEDHVYILTDLCHNEPTELKQNSGFVGIITIILYEEPGYELELDYRLIQFNKAFPNAKEIELIRP